MTILLYKDGRLVIDDGNPIEGISLEGLVACVSDPQSGDILKFDGKQWVAGAAASGLPAVSGTDNGKVLTVVEGAWAPAAGGGGGGGLLITATWDSDSGKCIMDKTAAEIYAAIQSATSVVLHYNDDTPSMQDMYYTVYGVRTNMNEGTQEVASYEILTNWSGSSFTSTSLDGYPAFSWD